MLFSVARTAPRIWRQNCVLYGSATDPLAEQQIRKLDTRFLLFLAIPRKLDSWGPDLLIQKGLVEVWVCIHRRSRADPREGDRFTWFCGFFLFLEISNCYVRNYIFQILQRHPLSFSRRFLGASLPRFLVNAVSPLPKNVPSSCNVGTFTKLDLGRVTCPSYTCQESCWFQVEVPHMFANPYP